MKQWKDDKTEYIYHCTTKQNLVLILKSGYLIPAEDNGAIYFSIGHPFLGCGEVIFKSKQKWDLSKLDGCSSPPVVWHNSKLSIDLFDIEIVGD